MARETPPTDADIHAHIDYLIIKSGNTMSGTTGTVLHIPHPDSNPEDDPQPACDRPLPKAEWTAKDTAIFPPGYRRFCKDCRVIAMPDLLAAGDMESDAASDTERDADPVRAP